MLKEDRLLVTKKETKAEGFSANNNADHYRALAKDIALLYSRLWKLPYNMAAKDHENKII